MTTDKTPDMPKRLQLERDDIIKREGFTSYALPLAMAFEDGFNACYEEQSKWCRCGEVILADTEDWANPNCADCYEDAGNHFDKKYQEVIQSLDALANEAQGFMSMANRHDHGNTNMQCLENRITEARLALDRVGVE